jgi:hypothetical protein
MSVSYETTSTLQAENIVALQNAARPHGRRWRVAATSRTSINIDADATTFETTSHTVCLRHEGRTHTFTERPADLMSPLASSVLLPKAWTSRGCIHKSRAAHGHGKEVRQALVEKGFCSPKIEAQLVKRRRLTVCLHETSLSASKLLADTAATYAARLLLHSCGKYLCFPKVLNQTNLLACLE